MSQLDISKMYNNRFPYTSCYRCGFALKNSKKKHIHHSYRKHIVNTQKLFDILNNGYIELGENDIYSFYFFDSIAQLSKIILTCNSSEVIDDYMSKAILLKWEKQEFSFRSPAYTQISIEKQFILFSTIFSLFKDYPVRLKQFILLNELTYWKTLKDMPYISFWFQNLINSITPRYISITKLITDEEIKNAKQYLFSKGTPITKANLTRLLGCNFFSIYNDLEI
jgi:hypothetical protein